VKLLPRYLNPNSYPTHPTSSSTRGVIIAPRERGSITTANLISEIIDLKYKLKD